MQNRIGSLSCKTELGTACLLHAPAWTYAAGHSDPLPVIGLASHITGVLFVFLPIPLVPLQLNYCAQTYVRQSARISLVSNDDVRLPVTMEQQLCSVSFARPGVHL